MTAHNKQIVTAAGGGSVTENKRGKISADKKVAKWNRKGGLSSLPFGSSTSSGRDKFQAPIKEGPKAALRGVSYGRTSVALRPVECSLTLWSHATEKT